MAWLMISSDQKAVFRRRPPCRSMKRITSSTTLFIIKQARSTLSVGAHWSEMTLTVCDRFLFVYFVDEVIFQEGRTELYDLMT